MTDTLIFAKKVREICIDLVFKKKAAHIGSALSIVDLLSVLYNRIMKVDPYNPKDQYRDRFLLSKGHACIALYSTLALKGFFNIKDLETYSDNGSIFTSHTNYKVPGIEFSAGSLGHILPICCGLALAAKKKSEPWRCYCIISDGELDEGSNWEALLFAPQHKLDNLIVIIDYNKIQSLGSTNEIIDLSPLKEKLRAFNWEVREINGHCHNEIELSLIKSNYNNGKPKAIIANTVKGKGISFMENKLLWHYKSPNEEEYKLSIEELHT